MGEMLDRTSVTYVLSFQPDKVKPDGAYHKLRVELKNAPRGTRVVHRAGYYAPKPYAQLNPLEKLLEAASQADGRRGGGGDRQRGAGGPVPRRGRARPTCRC